ncbi:hypothetical protein HMPREF9629_00472 [Peptoanaerobacter stomatis]|uniref:Signal peptidase I n=1 Tax=Peptoanaerobacter stomatis TaxID=796937 RepID=G9X249_9FIRM|nr:signal peptidase I [Peptoanaerobacter stomatis]EHL13172.1 hypothetical protein HMPREF9629_00472 [Peptoanaerobacter stomatis]
MKKEHRKKLLNSDRKYKVYTFFLLLSIILSALPFFKTKILSLPFAAPIYWSLIICIIYFCIPAINMPNKNFINGSLLGYAVSGAIIFVALEFLSAVFMKKLEASPYDISAIGTLLNILNIFPQLTAREMIRLYSFATAYKTMKYRRIAIVITTLIMILTDINFTKLQTIQQDRDLFIYLIKNVAPIITKNTLMSAFVFYGGILPSIVYIGIIELFQKCFPVLPELPWIVEGAIGIAFPSMYMTYIMDHSSNQGKTVVSGKENILYLISLFSATMFSWFCVGVFPIYPSVILTGSMEPLIYPGDVVLIEKMKEEKDIYNLSKGDIINFKREDITITHRIKEVITDEAGNRSFETKGDNNKAPDEIIVQPNDVKGIIVKVVPKAGLPVLILKEQDEVPEGVIDNK